jgi:hypothetical protein
MCTVNLIASSVTYHSDGVFADILEPHKAESTRPETVYTFLLVLADDYVLQSSARLQQKDSIGVTYHGIGIRHSHMAHLSH